MCGDAARRTDGKAFCCQGCEIVHDLLTESGLGHFYDLGSHPGVRAPRAASREKWAYLDTPEVRQRLLDFTDGQHSRVTFRVPAIHCVACVWLLENLFRLHPGVGPAQVNFPKREVAIRFSEAQLSLSELTALLASIGYEPTLTLGELDKAKPDRTRRRQWLQVGMAGFAFGNIMLYSLPLYLGLDSLSGPFLKVLFGGLSLALALPVVTFSAADYWRSAFLAVRQRILTLEIPIALGLAALYLQSAYEILSGRGEGYLDSLSGLVFFLLCGRVFQQKTYDRLVFDRDYKCFFPLAATRRAEAGEESVAISQIRVGDRLIVRNSELIPADARLVEGAAFIDYSFVTGESEPVAKEEGEYLYAGGQQLGGAIEVETVKPVSQSYLTSLWDQDAFQKSDAEDLPTMTNHYSRRFTIWVIGIAVGAALFWAAAGDAARGLKALASVLIVACPCALALAAPITLGTAQRVLARLGVFLKNAHVLERLARVNTIVFDKTGTLTTTGASTVQFYSAPAPPEPREWTPPTGGESALTEQEECWVYSLVRHSTHPHAVRIGRSFAGRHFPETVGSFLELPGCGIEGSVCGHEIWLGSPAWLRARGVVIPEGGVESPGQSVGSLVGLSLDGSYRGAFALANSLRPETAHLLEDLAGQYDLALLSGDNEKERQRFEGFFGEAGRLHFNQSPLDKLGFVRRLQTAGRTVMMVGDGLNDAGALKQSCVGVAVVEEVGAFSPASDVILEVSRVPRLGGILDLARRAGRIVRLSFGISAIYNGVGVAIAAAGLLSPLVCAVLMPLSSISVVLFANAATTWAARQAGLVERRLPQPGT